MVVSASRGSSLVPALLRDGINIACLGNGYGESGDLWYIVLPVLFVDRAVGGSGRERGACGWLLVNRVRAVFHIAQMRSRRDAPHE